MKSKSVPGHRLTFLSAAISYIALSSSFAQAQYNFGPEVQTTSMASITCDAGTGEFQFTNTVGASGNAYVPLVGNAAALITSSNAWAASLAVSLTATTLTNNGTGGTPAIGMALAVFSGGYGENRVLFILSQVNNTAGNDLSDYSEGLFGTVAKFAALNNGNSDVTTPSGASKFGMEGDSYLFLSGGTNDSPASESINNANGFLTLIYNASVNTLTGYYNGTPVGSYSVAGWGSNPPLTLAVVGAGSGKNVGVPAGTDMGSDFYAGPLPSLTAISSGANFVLTWPTNFIAFTLQSTTNLSPQAVWTTVSPALVVVNTNNTVTNAISGTQRFYRLSQ